jgi:hypothetical protein
LGAKRTCRQGAATADFDPTRTFASFDHLVGEGEQRGRHGEAERLRGRIRGLLSARAIRDRHAALEGVHLYVGDGASIRRPIVRHRGQVLIGHASIVEQLGWCMQAGIRRAVFTHCGSQVVRSDARQVGALMRRLGKEHGIDARLGYDGLRVCFGTA